MGGVMGSNLLGAEEPGNFRMLQGLEVASGQSAGGEMGIPDFAGAGQTRHKQ